MTLSDGTLNAKFKAETCDAVLHHKPEIVLFNQI